MLLSCSGTTMSGHATPIRQGGPAEFTPEIEVFLICCLIDLFLVLVWYLWISLKQTSSFQSTRVAYSDHSSNPVCGFGSAKPVLLRPNSTESNLFHHGETTYRVGWMIWICYSRALERRCLGYKDLFLSFRNSPRRKLKLETLRVAAILKPSYDGASERAARNMKSKVYREDKGSAISSS